jgi:hypothetical protein
MPARPILFVVAGIAVLIALAVAALSYMRAVNALSDFVARSKPNGWIGVVRIASGMVTGPGPFAAIGGSVM